MNTTRAGQSFLRLSKVLNLLHAHPRGLSIGYLADQVGVPEARLREEILDFYTADVLGVRPDTIVFVSSSGDEQDPAMAEVVRVVSDAPSAELGVQLLSPQQWFEVYETAAQVAQMHPDDDALTGAVDIIRDRILAGMPQRPDNDTGRTLAEAVQHHRVLRLAYSRAWRPGLVTRVVSPLRLVETGRGWELDALQDDGELRTFIIDRIRSVTVTGETFDPPADVDELLAEQRRSTIVDLVVPTRYQWAVDRYAESTHVIEGDEGDISIRAEFLPPVDERVGLILITAPDSFVLRPDGLKDAGRHMASMLLAHHGLD